MDAVAEAKLPKKASQGPKEGRRKLVRRKTGPKEEGRKFAEEEWEEKEETDTFLPSSDYLSADIVQPEVKCHMDTESCNTRLVLLKLSQRLPRELKLPHLTLLRVASGGQTGSEAGGGAQI